MPDGMEWNGMDALLAEYPISNIQYHIVQLLKVAIIRIRVFR